MYMCIWLFNIKIISKNEPKCHFTIKIFFGGGTAPSLSREETPSAYHTRLNTSPDPSLCGKGDTPPHTLPASLYGYWHCCFYSLTPV